MNERTLEPVEGSAMMERVLVAGDLSGLSPSERVSYYAQVCQSVGLNPLTRPFDYLKLSGKYVLYAKRDATDQLRKIHGVSIELSPPTFSDGICVISAKAKDKHGRTDEDMGAVPMPPDLRGEARANAILKCATKAKRRVTLSICGLGFLDETEVETIGEAEPVRVDFETGEVEKQLEPIVRPVEERRITEGQSKAFWARCRAKAKTFTEAGVTGEEIARDVLRVLGVEHTKEMLHRSFERSLELVDGFEPGKYVENPAAEQTF